MNLQADDDAISPNEVIDEFRRPVTYKEGIDLNRV